ncbi:MAG TPA: HD domain-containing phosphohydrolase [Solirubrobacteraceae bacterium]|nr:HD domain-containing phosphohydrolase [Solirubrobacteraceae bacterium]
MADDRQSRSELRREALRVARGLSEGDGALVAVLRELERERSRASETVRAVVRALAVTLQARDGYTGEHADAVHDLSLGVGARLGLDGAQMAELAAVALLHDVGKIGIPDEVLHKPGPLDEREWALMREHPVIGERILASVPGLEAVARAVRHEHERWDGRGYPDGLRGSQIPLSSRIVLACDAWHALVSDRPYRTALPREAATAELCRCSGTQFDPHVVSALLAESREPTGAGTARPDLETLLTGTAAGEPSLERELVALISVASAVAAAHRLDDVLDVAAEESRVAIDAASLSIERWMPERGMLRTLVNVGDLGPGEEHHPADEIYLLEGDRMLRRVLEEGGTYSCSADDPGTPAVERELLVALGKQSSVAVPIRFGGETWGQIWAARTAGQPPFDQRDARFLHAISGQIGAAIGRAEVFSRVSELAHTDGLTGLLNRRAFDEAIEAAVLQARSQGHDLALVLCDVDNLKELNDHDGHEAGDAALRSVAHVLQDVVAGRAHASVHRIGGDEFCVLLERADEVAGREVADALARRLTQARPAVGISCGVAALRAGQGRPADLLRAADAAQYAAKRAGRGRVVVASGAQHGGVGGSQGAGRRALRHGGDPDAGRLLVDALAVLDGPLADADPAERLAGVLRAVADAADASGWAVALAMGGADPRDLGAAARPGQLADLARRAPWLDAPDLVALRLGGLVEGRGGVVVRSEDPSAPRGLRARLADQGLEALLLVAVEAPEGTWLAQLAADERTAPLAAVEPVLRVLAPQALARPLAARLAAAG